MGADIHCYIEFCAPREQGDERPPFWQSHGGRINPGRNYLMFSILANVRSNDYENPPLFKPKGLPEDCGFWSNDENYLYISEDETMEDSCTPERAAYYVKSCGSHYKNNKDGKPTWVSHPDWHSHSWLTLAELKQAFAKYVELEHPQWEEYEKHRKGSIEELQKDHPEVDVKNSWLNKPFPHDLAPQYQAMIAAMEKLEEFGYTTRLVFWFDN